MGHSAKNTAERNKIEKGLALGTPSRAKVLPYFLAPFSAPFFGAIFCAAPQQIEHLDEEMATTQVNTFLWLNEHKKQTRDQ